MALKFVPLALGLLQIAAAGPAITLQDLEMADDTMSVGSYIREVRAAAPQDYHKSYENEGDGEIGYSRKKTGGGKKGYQHFDSFHKKAGDNYEFAKEDSYGHDDGEQAGAHSHPHEQKEKRREPESESLKEDDYYSEPTYERYEEAVPEKQKAKGSEVEEEPTERDHEDIKEGESDGNGGVEARGHDPSDYTLPEKYTWGPEDETK